MRARLNYSVPCCCDVWWASGWVGPYDTRDISLLDVCTHERYNYSNLGFKITHISNLSSASKLRTILKFAMKILSIFSINLILFWITKISYKSKRWKELKTGIFKTHIYNKNDLLLQEIKRKSWCLIFLSIKVLKENI